MKNIIVLFLGSLLFALTGCKPHQIIVHDIEYRDRIKIDSVVQTKYDSIRIIQKGDTVTVEKFKIRFQDRIKLRTDTVTKFIEKPVQVDKIIQVERKLNAWEKSTIFLGKIFLFLISVIAIYFIVKYIVKIKFY